MALDTFETLLSLGSGFAGGASKRKRENEILELDIKQKEQTARINRISSIEKSLLTLFNTGQFSAESMMAAIESVPTLVDQERGGQSFGLLEKKPTSINEDPSKRELFNQRKLQFEESQRRLIENEDFDRREAKRKAGVDAAKTAQAQELSKQKEVSDILKEEVDDIQSRIAENNRLFKDQDTPVVDRETARRENIDFSRVLSAKNRQRKKIRDTLKPPITKNNIKSKIEVFRKMIRSGLTTAKIVIESFKERLGKQVERGELTVDEATEFTQRLRRRLGGS